MSLIFLLEASEGSYKTSRRPLHANKTRRQGQPLMTYVFRSTSGHVTRTNNPFSKRAQPPSILKGDTAEFNEDMDYMIGAD